MISEPHPPPVRPDLPPPSQRPIAPGRLADRTNLPAFGLTWLFAALLPYMANLVGRHIPPPPLLAISLGICMLGLLAGLWFVESPQFGWRRMDDVALITGLALIVLVWALVPTDWLMVRYPYGILGLWLAPLLYDGLRRLSVKK